MTNYRGRITRIIGNDVYVQVSALAVDQDFGPMDIADAGSQFAVNDYVLIAQIDGAAEDIVIVGKLLADLSEIGPAIVLPTINNSFFTGQADGSWAWKTTAQTKTTLGIDAVEANVTALQTEVQPVNRGGTGKTSYTTGNYIKATGATTLSERTPAQVKTDLGLDGAITTAPSALPISTATQTALDTKRNNETTNLATSIDFNTMLTPGTFALGAANAAASTNIPDPVRGILTVTGGGGSTYLTQMYHTIDGNFVWTRTCLTAIPSWTAWQRLTVVSNNWTDITLNADWEPYDALIGSGYRQPQYKVANGEVKLRGFIRTEAVRGTGTHAIFTLSGLGPTEVEMFAVMSFAANVTGAASTGTAHTHTANYQNAIRVDVTTTGAINLICVANQSLFVGSWLSLSGIYWDLG